MFLGKMTNITILLYTHTDVKWVHRYWHQQTNKYLKNYSKVVFINEDNFDCGLDYKVVLYDDTKPYRQRIYDSLQQLHDDLVVIFHHEDMFLYNTPDYGFLYRNISSWWNITTKSS